MCCYTHGNEQYPGAIAEHENVRCRCGCGGNCIRRATQEDMLCDTCSGRSSQEPIQSQPPHTSLPTALDRVKARFNRDPSLNEEPIEIGLEEFKGRRTQVEPKIRRKYSSYGDPDATDYMS